MSDDILRIGNASGYWGDDLGVLRRQVEGGPIDVVTLDFLAEITMSILQKQKSRDPRLGFARDFVDQLAGVMQQALDDGVVVISNAGGVAPRACAEAILECARSLGLSPRVGIVAGDDLMPSLEEWQERGIDLSNMDDGRSFDEIRDRISSANAYFGATPVVKALEMGAQFVVTGRVTDTGISLAPMIHRFGWSMSDHDQLASGIVAGHILECGAQSTGGNFSDWRRVQSFDEIGYPIAEIHPDGSFVITKHEGSGGLVDVATVKEQLVYEMGDPRSYITPDVVADFSSIRVAQEGPDRVRVWGVRGAPPTSTLKVSVSYHDGHKASGAVIVSGPEARAKSDLFAEIFWNRLPEFEDTLTERVGADATWGPRSPSHEANEIYLRFGARDHDRGKLSEFSKMLPALILSGPPGVAVTGGRPRIQDVVAYWPMLVPRELCRAEVELLGGGETLRAQLGFMSASGEGRVSGSPAEPGAAAPTPRGETLRVPLSRLVHGRSGDKGDTCNIGVIARHEGIYPWLVEFLSAERVRGYFEGIVQGRVERFEVPNLLALNFLLHETLGGGGTLSLRIDAQGKTLSHALFAMEVEVDRSLLDLVRQARGARRSG